jgi:PAS domain S-box-containing protein
MDRKPTYEELEKRIEALEEALARRARAQEAADAQRQEFISIFDSIDEAIYISDPETYEILYVNEATRSTFGFDVVGKKCHRVFQGLDRPCDFCTNTMIFRENLGKPHVWEFQNKLNGRWYRCIDRAIRWPDGRMVRYEMAIDIHDLKEAQKALQAREERYRRMTEAVTDYVFTVRTQNGSPVETIHGSACEPITGYTPEEFKANPYLWIQMVHEDDREAVTEHTAQILSGKEVGPIEHRIIRKDNAVRWVSNTPVPYYDANGTVLSYDGLIRDITQRKEAEEALRDREANYRLLFSAETDAIIVVDAETKKIVEANEAALTLYGYPRDEFLGLEAMALSTEPEVAAAHIEEVAASKAVVASPGPVQRMHRKRDGTSFAVEISSGLYALKDRKMVCAIIRDITERRRIEEALKDSVRELEVRLNERTAELVQVNKRLEQEMTECKTAENGLPAREQYLFQEETRMEMLRFANELALKLMHELRNPLLSIGGFSRRISGMDQPPEKLKEYARIIQQESVRLSQVLDEVLDHLKGAAEETWGNESSGGPLHVE